MVVRTRTFTVTKYANPHLKCTECGTTVEGRRDDTYRNYPCSHRDFNSICFSWSPVDGCTCKDNHG